MKQFSLLAVLAVTAITFTAQASEPEVYSLKKGGVQALEALAPNIILEGSNYWIMKTPLMDEKTDYFFLKFPVTEKDLAWLNRDANIIDVRLGEHVIVTFKNERDQKAVTERIHEYTGQCGVLRLLTADAIGIGMPTPAPILTAKTPEVEGWVSQASLNNITATINALTSMGSRYHSHAVGVLAGDKLAQVYNDRVPLHRTDVTIETFIHKKTKQKSVIARIAGKEFPSERVIIGSHLDSTAGFFGSGDVAPGADDNASGTATNLEIFELMMKNNIYPKRTIEFHAYAAEEAGLFGSAEIAQTYKTNGIGVAAMVQFDMNGYSPSSGNSIFLVTNETNAELTHNLSTYIDYYVARAWTKKALTAGSSDHASWTKAGFPAAFPTEDTTNYNKKIHTANDTLANINDPEKMRLFAQLGLAYLVHYAGFQPQP